MSPKSIAVFDPVFVNTLEFLRRRAEKEAEFLTDFRSKQAVPEAADWSGDWHDRLQTGQLFSKEGLSEQFMRLLRESDRNGTVGDLMLVALQSDILSCLHRAVASRQSSYVRCDAHAWARRRGHADPQGVWLNKWLAPLEAIDRISKSEEA